MPLTSCSSTKKQILLSTYSYCNDNWYKIKNFPLFWIEVWNLQKFPPMIGWSAAILFQWELIFRVFSWNTHQRTTNGHYLKQNPCAAITPINKRKVMLMFFFFLQCCVRCPPPSLLIGLKGIKEWSAIWALSKISNCYHAYPVKMWANTYSQWTHLNELTMTKLQWSHGQLILWAHKCEIFVTSLWEHSTSPDCTGLQVAIDETTKVPS